MTDFNKNLGGDEWHDALLGCNGEVLDKVKRVLNEYNQKWHKPILKWTSKNEEVLETGSGTGQMSAALSENGRKVTLMDFSLKSIDFSRILFNYLKINGEFIMADMLKPFPFKDNTFDCVWSSGVLEHFSENEIIPILKESQRVSKKKVISIVPNAFSLSYRFGKWYQQLRGYWQYGREIPEYSMRKYYKKAGLKVIAEYSIDPIHAFDFLVMLKKKPIGEYFLKKLKQIPEGLLKGINQGYLLVTIGEKNNNE